MADWTKVVNAMIKRMARYPKGSKVDLARWDKTKPCPVDGAELVRDEVYSNYDHKLCKSAARSLKAKRKNRVAQHSALHFCGFIWTDGKWFYEGVWVFNSHVDTLRARTLEAVIKKTNKKYGME